MNESSEKKMYLGTGLKYLNLIFTALEGKKVL